MTDRFSQLHSPFADLFTLSLRFSDKPPKLHSVFVGADALVVDALFRASTNGPTRTTMRLEDGFSTYCYLN